MAGAGGWSVVDVQSGAVVSMRGAPQRALLQGRADELVMLLNYLETDRPDLLARVCRRWAI
jgi:hypothetical protein